jgi:hypothetical protein
MGALDGNDNWPFGNHHSFGFTDAGFLAQLAPAYLQLNLGNWEFIFRRAKLAIGRNHIVFRHILERRGLETLQGIQQAISGAAACSRGIRKR